MNRNWLGWALYAGGVIGLAVALHLAGATIASSVLLIAIGALIGAGLTGDD
jgi:hypothetical protein